MLSVMETRRSQITRHWLGRLSFSFFVVAFFLGWDGYKRYSTGVEDWLTFLDFLAAAMSLGLGFMGVRERHRPSDPK
jgi:hypothetical protein